MSLITACASLGGADETGIADDMSPTGTEGVTYLDAVAEFSECTEEAGFPQEVWDAFASGGSSAVKDPGHRVGIESCMEESQLSQFVYPSGDTTFDEDFLNRENEFRREAAECMAAKGWDQEELVYDEDGFLVPVGDGSVLAEEEVGAITQDLDDCAREIGSPFGG